jgi:hypothetical protein
MVRMNEREQFIRTFQLFFRNYIERTRTMTEAQVVSGLRAILAARNHHGVEVAFLKSIALRPTDDPTDEISRLSSQLNFAARPGAGPFDLWNIMERALRERLEQLHKKPGGM